MSVNHTTANQAGGKSHHIRIEEREKAYITGVIEVYSFHENEIVLKVDSGSVVITGENLHVGKLVLEEGKLDVTGRVDSIHYEAPSLGSGMFANWKRRKK